MQLTNNYYREVGFRNSINPDVFRNRRPDRVSARRPELAAPLQPRQRAQPGERGIPHLGERVPEHAVQNGGRFVLQSVSLLPEDDGELAGRSLHREYCFAPFSVSLCRTSFCPI